jgi:DNA-binding NarL/FixJ family response regulator
MHPTRILIADDHAVVREGLPGLILAHGHDWEICGAAVDAEAAVAMAIELQPDIVIMDYKMGVIDGLAAAGQIKERVPHAEVLIFSGAVETCSLLEIYRSSVGGFMLKSEEVEELMPALEALRHHHRFRSRQVTECYLRIVEDAAAVGTVSARELETLRMIATGKSSKEIAAEMGISLKTVESHRTHLNRKLHCNSAVELTRYALRNGLVDL